MSELTMSNISSIEPTEPVDIIEEIGEPKSLAARREDLVLRLQLNRRVLALKLVGPEQSKGFPRSAAMRFISNHSTRDLIHKAANAALGLQTFRALHWGLSALKFIRKQIQKR